jgi:type IV secretory pathway VirB4 component
MMGIYIQPNIIECKNLDALKQEYHYFLHNRTIDFKDLYENKHYFVFAEPGYGKTALLRELHANAIKNGFQSVYIDLKKISMVNLNYS